MTNRPESKGPFRPWPGVQNVDYMYLWLQYQYLKGIYNSTEHHCFRKKSSIIDFRLDSKHASEYYASHFQTDNYMLKVNYRNTKTRCEICSNVEICHWRRSGVFIVNFKYTSQLALVFLHLTLNR